MKTVKLSDLSSGSYVNYNGEVITKEQAVQIISSGQTPDLYTISDEWINGALLSLSQERKEGKEISESYSAPDPNTMKILY